MLERVQGVPLLSWLAASLAQDGAHRFFLVAQPGCMVEAKSCFPKDLELTVCAEQDPADLLHVFLSSTDEEESSVAVVTGPAVYLRSSGARPQGRTSRRTAVCLANREELMEALDHEFSFSHFLVEHSAACKEDMGFYSVSDYEELLPWQRAMNRDQVLRLAHDGVTVWDWDNTYVSPWTMVGSGTEILPGTVLAGCNNVGSGCRLGPDTFLTDCSVADGAKIIFSTARDVTVGRDCIVGPYTVLRDGTWMEPSSRVGSFAELDHSTLGPGAHAEGHGFLHDMTLEEDAACQRGFFGDSREASSKRERAKLKR